MNVELVLEAIHGIRTGLAQIDSALDLLAAELVAEAGLEPDEAPSETPEQPQTLSEATAPEEEEDPVLREVLMRPLYYMEGGGTIGRVADILDTDYLQLRTAEGHVVATAQDMLLAIRRGVALILHADDGDSAAVTW